ncbi:MAG: methylated-DNA--[protein]-cysteine S-methyltransferase [Thermovirgaceae bacterium]|nr:methylated-DNA--[protein]-cysteine S-methyltransferase [Synergistales bacterium]MDI9393098.1 methylated-DNA--[protein]-cysteine S-methyltransferase [Synergistota bacterium]NLV64962.1 methylated-DNA--[protein]-cysteine S-methyltransferase [Synergistaceae bacterium]MDD3133954.1 methylated-DNA--[protein]-cysteine S-methyltransferase [Synergistales bacterium]MDD3830044.1 methylated-DNA--[protein]-cysteine S-methyltransferase [Synergistales bacterium]
MLSVRETVIGPVGIEEDEGSITRLFLPNKARRIKGPDGEGTPLLAEAFGQLDLYLEGKLQRFSLPLRPEGTEFMKRVWRELLKVPYGRTTTYRELAVAAGSPGGSRAAGMANAKNPIAIFIPCHRVIGSNGKLVGFGGGLELKSWLLDLEARNME